MAISGGCLCGGVKYQVSGTPQFAANCHCSMCRRQTGSAYLPAVGFDKNEFKFTKGENLVSKYSSSPGGERWFCRECGSALGGASKDQPMVFINMGTMEGDPGIKPQMHVFVGSKAPWDEITDKLPQHKEFPG